MSLRWLKGSIGYLFLTLLAVTIIFKIQSKTLRTLSNVKSKDAKQQDGENVEILILNAESQRAKTERKELKEISTFSSSACQLFKKPLNVVYTGLLDDRVTISGSKKPYKGPIVEGWGPEASRDIKEYVNPQVNSVILAPFNLNNDPMWCTSTKLFIFQHSRPSNFNVRLDNRRTWFAFLKEYPFIKAIFVVGRPKGPKAGEIQRKIFEEHELYGDILQVDYFEHANNNTLKTILTLKYIFTLNWDGHHPEYVMKADDDIYLNIPKLVDILFENKNYRANSLETALKKRWPPMFGYLFVVSEVLLVPPQSVDEKYTDYLICPTYFYNQTFYPTFTSGTGYVMPWWSVPCFYQESFNIPYFFIEDVFMGGFVADRCLVPKKHVLGYSTGGKEIADLNATDDLLIHYVDHSDKFNIHRIITEVDNQKLIIQLKR